jgi:hypothetical protein
MEIPNGTNRLNHVKRSAVFHFQSKPFGIPYGRINHLCRDWNKRMLTIVLDGFLLSMKCSSSTNWLPSPSFIFGLGVTNDAAKPDCTLPTGDDGSLYEGRSSGNLIIIKINETLLSKKQQSCQKCKHQKSMKHYSQGSNNRVKNANTGNHTLIS